MFGMEHVIGMRGVFERLLVVIFVNLFVARLFIKFGCGRLIDDGDNRCLDCGGNGRLGLLFSRRRVNSCVVVAAFIMIMFTMMIVVMIMIVGMRAIVMLVGFVIMSLVIMGFRIGVVFGRVERLVIAVGLRSLRRIGGGILDDFALGAVAMTA